MNAKQLSVEQEFGEPFWDVVRGFARDGEGLTATAQILGFPVNTFSRMVGREGLRDIFPPPSETNGTKSLRVRADD